MSFPCGTGHASLGQLEREHLGRIENALGDLLLSSRLEARAQNLDGTKVESAIVSLLFAMAARQAFLNACDTGEEFHIDTCRRAAEEAALWVINRNQRVFGIN